MSTPTNPTATSPSGSAPEEGLLELRSTLRRLAELPPRSAADPYVTVYVASESAVAQAADAYALRWKDLLRDLEQAGVDQPTVAALSAARGEHGEGGTRVVVAAGGEVELATSLPVPTDATAVWTEPLPYLLPLLDWAQAQVPHLVVRTDRQGADITVSSTGSEESVEPDTFPIHKTGRGGFSSARYERRVENSWEETAKDVATEVHTLVERHGAALVLLGGDTHAVGLVRDALPQATAQKVRLIEGGRSRDGSQEEVSVELAAHLAQAVEADLDTFATYRGRTDPAQPVLVADGPGQTVEALRTAQVDTLLLADGMADPGMAYAGADPLLLALTEPELEGVAPATEVRLLSALIRAALAQGAAVRLVPKGSERTPREGIGALLRSARGPVEG